jgi:hypothetical protein
MNETAQQYIDRILGNLREADPWEVLSTTPSSLRRLVDGRSETELGHREKQGQWSVREILAHWPTPSWLRAGGFEAFSPVTAPRCSPTIRTSSRASS